MTTVILRPNLAEELESEAQRRQTDVQSLVNDLLQEQLWREWHKPIQEEAERFRARHAEMLAQYAGQHIAMRDGVVLDHDADLQTLHSRVRAKYGKVPILFTPVTSEPIQTFRILGARQKVSP